jgi:HKD family nuclease
MQNLKHLGLAELLDLLIDQTTRYLQIRIYGGNEEHFQRCQLLMTQIQREIKLRKADIDEHPDTSFHQEDGTHYGQKKSSIIVK